MADESFSSQMNPTKPEEDISRRNSTGKKVSSNSGEKPLPHYLRASSGSCHDFCKYGGKQAFEEKIRHPIPKRLVAKPNDSQSSVDSVVSLERNKSSMVKLKNSPDSITRSPNAPNSYKQQVLTRSLDSLIFVGTDVSRERKKASSLAKVKAAPSSKIHTYDTSKQMKQKVSASTEKLEVSLDKGSTEGKQKNFSGKHQTSLNPKSAVVKPLSSPVVTGDLNGKSDVKIGKRTGTSRVPIKKVLTSTVSLSPRPSLSRVAILNRKHQSLKKVASPLKNHNNIRKAEPTKPKNDEVPEKTLYVIKMETENITLESDQNEICATQVGLLPHPSSLSPKSSSLSSTSPHEEEEEEVKEQNQQDSEDEEGEDQPEDEEEEEEDQQESEYTLSDSEDDMFSENSETESMEDSETLDMNSKMHKRTGLVHADKDDDEALKLKFRRGKVVDIQLENNAPRRLKFRRGKVFKNQNVTADARRRQFKTREEIEDNITETGTERVVLKHQDVQGKKDAQGLFNNVIEETASKLVETRKSKVKALVGAFETVILLQDTKPSAKTVD